MKEEKKMKINKVELIPVTVPLEQPIRHAFYARTEGKHIIVKIYSDEGFMGIGCGSVLTPSYCMDSQESAMSKLKDLAKGVLIGANPLNTEMILAQCDAALRFNSLIKAHIDYALYDLKGKILNVPVYDLLGGLARETMPAEWILTLDTPENQVKASLKYLAAGFKSFKLKPGADLKMAVARFSAVRDAVGPDVEIGIDLDGILNSHDAIRLIRALERYDLHFAEQPVTKMDIRGFGEVKNKVGVPIVADESAWSIEETVNLINANACDICHLALDRIGGFRKALQFRALMDAHRMDYAICTYNSPGINHAVISHFAASCTKRGPIVDELATILMFTGGTDTDHIIRPDITKKINSRIVDGTAYAPKGPGLGIELNEELVKSYLTMGVSPIVITA
jgi:L-alanine-DL-glutamate epimerase-like enolase superfamily enzyme